MSNIECSLTFAQKRRKDDCIQSIGKNAIRGNDVRIEEERGSLLQPLSKKPWSQVAIHLKVLTLRPVSRQSMWDDEPNSINPSRVYACVQSQMEIEQKTRCGK